MTEKEEQDRLDMKRAKRREYYSKNKDKIAAIQKRYRETHRDQIRDYQRAYRKNNPGIVEQWRRNSVLSAYMKMQAEKEKQ